MKPYKRLLALLLSFALCFSVAGCGNGDLGGTASAQLDSFTAGANGQFESDSADERGSKGAEEEGGTVTGAAESGQGLIREDVGRTGSFDLAEVVPYSGEAYTEINGNIPFFEDSELTSTSYESYSELDMLGRCGVAIACVGQDIMPTEKRGDISSVKPSGWQTAKYEGLVEGNYLYNRCHLLGFQLTGENANEKNLITGTRYMNVDGMLPFENMIADYVKETNNHVLYRVTPVFDGDNLVANGVLMEAKSVEDEGEAILFCVFCYNVQPGVTIHYADGSSELDSGGALPADAAPGNSGEYVVNGENGKIHINGACAATGSGDGAMNSPVYFSTYEEAEAYSEQIAPSLEKRQCGNCW